MEHDDALSSDDLLISCPYQARSGRKSNKSRFLWPSLLLMRMLILLLLLLLNSAMVIMMQEA